MILLRSFTFELELFRCRNLIEREYVTYGYNCHRMFSQGVLMKCHIFTLHLTLKIVLGAISTLFSLLIKQSNIIQRNILNNVRSSDRVNYKAK